MVAQDAHSTSRDNIGRTALSAPADPLSDLAPVELAQQLVEWNDTGVEVAPVTLSALVESAVERWSDRPALLGAGGVVSFAELESRANRLARYLVGLGVGPERVVALVLPRSAEVVVAQVAVVKAGGAYLPVDPDYPVERIAFMVADSRPVVVLTFASLVSRVPVVEGVPVVAVDAPGVVAEVAALSGALVSDVDRLSELSVDHAAYVIYT
ncbi:AMP-binding protein, partial [Planosporangium flavigriseum]|uniref:AMP-binding protein n=1 Tax=Planosporangium flavigriseum TaxID=373681 RepID=UPI0031D3320A